MVTIKIFKIAFYFSILFQYFSKNLIFQTTKKPKNDWFKSNSPIQDSIHLDQQNFLKVNQAESSISASLSEGSSDLKFANHFITKYLSMESIILSLQQEFQDKLNLNVGQIMKNKLAKILEDFSKIVKKTIEESDQKLQESEKNLTELLSGITMVSSLIHTQIFQSGPNKNKLFIFQKGDSQLAIFRKQKIQGSLNQQGFVYYPYLLTLPQTCPQQKLQYSFVSICSNLELQNNLNKNNNYFFEIVDLQKDDIVVEGTFKLFSNIPINLLTFFINYFFKQTVSFNNSTKVFKDLAIEIKQKFKHFENQIKEQKTLLKQNKLIPPLQRGYTQQNLQADYKKPRYPEFTQSQIYNPDQMNYSQYNNPILLHSHNSHLPYHFSKQLSVPQNNDQVHYPIQKGWSQITPVNSKAIPTNVNQKYQASNSFKIPSIVYYQHIQRTNPATSIQNQTPIFNNQVLYQDFGSAAKMGPFSSKNVFYNSVIYDQKAYFVQEKTQSNIFNQKQFQNNEIFGKQLNEQEKKEQQYPSIKKHYLKSPLRQAQEDVLNENNLKEGETNGTISCSALKEVQTQNNEKSLRDQIIMREVPNPSIKRNSEEQFNQFFRECRKVNQISNNFYLTKLLQYCSIDKLLERNLSQNTGQSFLMQTYDNLILDKCIHENLYKVFQFNEKEGEKLRTNIDFDLFEKILGKIKRQMVKENTIKNIDQQKEPRIKNKEKKHEKIINIQMVIENQKEESLMSEQKKFEIDEIILIEQLEKELKNWRQNEIEGMNENENGN